MVFGFYAAPKIPAAALCASVLYLPTNIHSLLLFLLLQLLLLLIRVLSRVLLLVVHRQDFQHGIDTMRPAHRLPPDLAQAIATEVRVLSTVLTRSASPTALPPTSPRPLLPR